MNDELFSYTKLKRAIIAAIAINQAILSSNFSNLFIGNFFC